VASAAGLSGSDAEEDSSNGSLVVTEQGEHDDPPLSPAFARTTSSEHRKEVKEWLSALPRDMGSYLDVFIQDGFDSLDSVATLTADDLDAMSVKRGHSRLILAGVKKLQGQQGAEAPVLTEPAAVPFTGTAQAVKVKLCPQSCFHHKHLSLLDAATGFRFSSTVGIQGFMVH
jgi:hypothetical protein